MKTKIIFIIFSKTLLAQTILHQDLYMFSNVFQEFGLNVTFKLDNKKSNKTENGFLEINNNKQLKLKLGPKFFFLNSQDLRIFDLRTNQIMIQEPDSNSFIYFKNFFDKTKIVSIDINEINNNMFTLDYNSYIIEISKNSPFYSCTINFGDYKITLNDIFIDTLKSSHEIFNVDTSSSYIIDLRE